jgi:class 3 adenylate cyclase
MVGATEYFSRFGAAAASQLQLLHVDLVGECLARHQGRLVDIAVDGAFVTFRCRGPMRLARASISSGVTESG